MPIYLYRNLKTGETFEIEQRMTDDALTEHPETGEPVKRLIQPVAIAFKGSGFYVNDSRSSSKQPAAGSGASEASTSASGGGESAPAAGAAKAAAASSASSSAD